MPTPKFTATLLHTYSIVTLTSMKGVSFKLLLLSQSSGAVALAKRTFLYSHVHQSIVLMSPLVLHATAHAIVWPHGSILQIPHTIVLLHQRIICREFLKH